MLSKEDGKIDWSKSATEIYNQFRAFYPWPGVWTRWNRKLLKVIDLQLDALQKTTEPVNPGTVLNDGVVGCGNGTYIKIKSLQLEGKNEVSIKDFLNGQRDFVGSKLG
jgi:methionyl-tRNA formyltransferase